MRKPLICLLSAAFLFAFTTCTPCPECPEAPTAGATTQANPDDFTYVVGERIGKIVKGMTITEVKATYGADQLKAGTLYGPEGIEYEGYRLFPDTDNELELAEAEGGFTANTWQKGGQWTSAEHGIRVGTSLAQLNRLNGRPFEFYGFDWDYGGLVSDWKGGTLEGYRLQLGYDRDFVDYEGSFLEKAIGDQPVSSDLPDLQDAGLYVRQLYLSID